MGFESIGGNNEKPAVSMTREQFDRIRNTFGDDMKSEDFISELENLGIQLDSGNIDILVDGEPMTMVTDSDDFGTILE